MERAPVNELAQRLNRRWESLLAATGNTERLLGKLSSLSEFATEDSSIVVFGSTGRGEVTEASDIDWTLLVDGPADPNHANLVTAIDAKLRELGLKKPGRTETFGVMDFSHQLVHYIAGTNDTNQNLTRRVLLLLESAAVTKPLVRSKVIGNVLERYIRHDVVAPRSQPPSRVIPHFLLNDVVRYWRTMASDYAAKMWERHNEGWGLRNIKLRFSRKLIFVAGLLACFSFELNPPENAEEIRGDRDNLPATLTNYIIPRLNLTPLDALAAFFNGHGYDSIAARLFDSYDRFLAILLDPEKRTELDELPIDRALESNVWREAHDASQDFRNGLEQLFLREDGILKELTLRFCVF